MFLIYFTIRRIIEQLESNEFDHAFSSEELDVVGILGLLLSQRKDSSTKSGIKGVVEEFSDGHLVDLSLVILARLHQFLQVSKHFVRMAALHNLFIDVLSFLLSCLNLCVEMDLVIELNINFFLFFVESKFDLLDRGMIAEQICESGSALTSPKFLLITRLLQRDLL